MLQTQVLNLQINGNDDDYSFLVIATGETVLMVLNKFIPDAEMVLHLFLPIRLEQGDFRTTQQTYFQNWFRGIDDR